MSRELGLAKHINNCLYQLAGRVICCYATVATYQFNTQWMWGIAAQPRVTTPQFIMRCCSSCFSFFNPSYPLSWSTHIRSSFTTHFQRIFMNTNWLLFTVCCCKCTSIPAILWSSVVLPCVEWNSCNLKIMIGNVQEQRWCSTYSK